MDAPLIGPCHRTAEIDRFKSDSSRAPALHRAVRYFQIKIWITRHPALMPMAVQVLTCIGDQDRARAMRFPALAIHLLDRPRPHLSRSRSPTSSLNALPGRPLEHFEPEVVFPPDDPCYLFEKKAESVLHRLRTLDRGIPAYLDCHPDLS